MVDKQQQQMIKQQIYVNLVIFPLFLKIWQPPPPKKKTNRKDGHQICSQS